jgi:hypothetical protein
MMSAATIPVHAYEVRPRKDYRSVDLISDALPYQHHRIALESFLIAGWQMMRPLCHRRILHTFYGIWLRDVAPIELVSCGVLTQTAAMRQLVSATAEMRCCSSQFR